MWGKIMYPSPNFKGCTDEVWMDEQFHPTHYDGHGYLSMMGFKLNYINWLKGPLPQGTGSLSRPGNGMLPDSKRLFTELKLTFNKKTP